MTNIILAEARKAYQAGDRVRMRDLLKQALASDSNNIEVWLLATYATTNVDQQHQFLERAKQINRADARISKREKELFPEADSAFLLEPEPTPASRASQSPAMPAQGVSRSPSRLPHSLSPIDHIPTLADGVRLKPQGRVPLWTLIPVGLLLLLGIAAIVTPGRAVDTPEAVILRFYPALQARDNATLASLLSDDAKALCGDNLVQCIDVQAQQFQNFSIASSTVTGQSATVKLRFQIQGFAEDQCQDFILTQTSQGWKIQKDVSQIAPCSSQIAALPSQGVPSSDLPTPTQDAAQVAIAQTQNGMLLASTLTATFLAPAQTQTALSVTQTQSAIAITQTALSLGETSTPLALTQVASTATQGAGQYKSSLKGMLVAAKNIQGKMQIVTLNADGSNLMSLNAAGIDPSWSPDGKHIAYTNREHQAAIHIMAADGTGSKEVPIQDAPFGTGWASWSADGNSLLLEGGTRMGLHAVFVSGLDANTVKQILDDTQSGGWNTWSPDNKQLLFVKDDQVWTVSVSGGTPRSLVKQPGARAAVWSPDGKQIAFDAGDDNDRGLYLMDADGSSLHRLTLKGVYVGLPAWSPDGKHLGALCYDNRTHANAICVLDVDGTNLTVISDSGFDGRINWKP